MNEINVVPYIDVMLVLLVIFMVTAPLITPGVVDVPSIGKSSVAPALPLEVIIKADASITVRDRDRSVRRDPRSGGVQPLLARHRPPVDPVRKFHGGVLQHPPAPDDAHLK